MKNEKNQNPTDSYFEPSNNETYDDVLIGFFSLKGRSGRLEFFKIQSMVFLFMGINIVYFVPIASKEYITGFIITSWLMRLALIPMTVRRLHDSNLSGLYYLITLPPYVFSRVDHLFFDYITLGIGIYYLYLILRAGDPYPNDYGIPNPPKKYGNKTINLTCMLVFILIIISGILATN